MPVWYRRIKSLALHAGPALVKILHIIHSANPAIGGPIEGVKQLAQALSNFEAEVELVCLDPPDAPWLKSFPFPVHAMGPSYLGYGYSPRLIPWLKAHYQNYAVVVVNGLWQFNGFAAWHVLRKTDTPYFVFAHGMLDPWFKKHYPLKHLKKWLYWPWAQYRILRDATAVLFTCAEAKLQAKKSFWLYRCNEKVIHYGTKGCQGDAEMQKRAFLAHFPQLQGKRLILFLSRVHEKKGCDLLMKAFHRFLADAPESDFHLVLAGPSDNSFGHKLREMAGCLGMESRITWTGMLEGDLKWGAFLASEAFILPSHQENFGIAVAEALSASLPVLISNKVNIWREIDREKAGLIENDDEEGTLSLLKRWNALNECERLEVRKNARHCFLEHFEITQAAKTLLEVYGDALERRSK